MMTTFRFVSSRGGILPAHGVIPVQGKTSTTGNAANGRRRCPTQNVAVSTQTRGQPARTVKYKSIDINVKLRLVPAIPNWRES
jgi:hypothetical protein